MLGGNHRINTSCFLPPSSNLLAITYKIKIAYIKKLQIIIIDSLTLG